MAYNKAKAEKEWLRWKEAEEKKLRELGVDEETIQRLHTYDWAQFNKERQYLQRQVDWSPYVDWVSAQDLELPVEDTESLLDSIEDMELFSLLHTVDKLTLEILFMKMDGYSSKEIASAFGMGGMAAFTGYYPPVQAGAECGAVCSGFLLGRCGLSRRYGIIAHHCTPAFSCS